RETSTVECILQYGGTARSPSDTADAEVEISLFLIITVTITK
ncbi:MAG: hypothetical protein ACJA09_002719, partial [Alcanivorax sp.]